MTMYFFYQETEKGRWLPALASERDNTIKSKKPALVSALDVDNSFDEDLSVDEIRALKYVGPLYFDWDSESIEEAAQYFKELLVKLQGMGVELSMLRLYATGKKGFHCEIPMQVFMGKVPATGIQNLPDIYREMAHALFVPTLDLRIYTARRGRMWRCPNVLRDNGKYKVQLTVEEALSITHELYEQVCSSPRNSLPVEPPALNAELALLYAQSKDKVERGVSKKKAKKNQADALKKFGGEWPETAELIFSGVAIKPDVGWNFISMQLAILASELGKSEQDLLTASEPLVNGHQGDSSRYNTAKKRRDDLREMFRYVNGSPCYEFSVGGVLSLLIPEVRANCDLNLGDFVPDVPEAPVAQTQTEDGEPKPEVEVIPEEDDSSPVRVSKAGVFVRTDAGYAKACDIGMGKVTLLRKMDDTDIGYEVEVFKGSKPKGLHVLPMDKLHSKQAFQSWSFTWSASMGASDAQTSKLADILSRRAETNGNVVYVVTKEGVDLIVKISSDAPTTTELIWASPKVVIGADGGKYRFRPNMDKAGVFRSDLMDAPDLTLEDAEWIDHMLKMNTTENLGKLLGWFCAAFLCQIIRRIYRQFPSLQVFGQAGAGKSKTTGLLNHLHYYLKDPKSLMATGQSPWPMVVAVASSASQPVIFEEVKQREMAKQLKDFLLNVFRNNYDGHSMARGAISRDTASKETVVNEYDNSAPIAFVGESPENQSAILERCIVVSLSKEHRYGKGQHFHFVSERRTELGKLGKCLAINAMSVNVDQMKTDFKAIFKQVQESVGPKAEEMERPVFNLSVVVLGLKLLQDTLHQVFGDRFDDRIAEMKENLIENAGGHMPDNMTEVARVIDVMAQLSRNPDMQYKLQLGLDYTMSEDGKFLDLKMRNAYAKYVKWQRSLGMEVLFDNESAFITSTSNYGGAVKRSCPDNLALYDSPRAVVFRFSVEYLDNDKVDGFWDGS